MNKIVQKEDKILRKIAKEVPTESIKSQRIGTIIRKMIKALDSQEDGIAIAAPQIGENLRIFVVSKRLFKIMEEEKMKGQEFKKEKLGVFEKESADFKDLVFINPKILKTSKNKIVVEEGCLSIRWFYGKVKRSEKTLIKAYDKNGKLFTLGGSGLLSQIFQHEIDHLDGILFIDKATDLKEMPPQKSKQ